MARRGIPRLPRELCDFIIDFLHTDSHALAECALVCRAWTLASRYHLFGHIDLSSKKTRRLLSLTTFNDLLASPHSTFPVSVRKLDFFNDPYDQVLLGSQLPCLCDIIPRSVQLRQLRELALSELPFELLSSFPRLETLRLYGITAGRGLVRLGKCIPRLQHLVLNHVYALRYLDEEDTDGSGHGATKDSNRPSSTPLADLRSITVRGSSVSFLPWLVLLAPSARLQLVDIADLAPTEIPSLVWYLRRISTLPERIRLTLKSGYRVFDDDADLWDQLAAVLGEKTRLDVVIYAGDDEDGCIEEQDAVLRSRFPRIARLQLLTILPASEA
ncbi:hypothetical protein C8F01DRAFT_1154879 [Mycena amicta]|nr:hypothetical protein C8F01DRAFT_1154879 [Mycena amicta]